MGQYFETDEKTASNLHIFEARLHDMTMNIYTDIGLFAVDKVDFGTKLLLETIKLENNKKVLDMGCGTGIIGIYLNKKYNATVDMVDVNKRAVHVSTMNIKYTNVQNVNCILSDTYENVTDTYDYIITNPPIRAGKVKIYEIIKDAKNYLNKDGKLFVVIRKNHGALTLIKDMQNIYNVEILEKSKGFYILEFCAK